MKTVSDEKNDELDDEKKIGGGKDER